jgi:UPF0042 nucleotide-binding protein
MTPLSNNPLPNKSGPFDSRSGKAPGKINVVIVTGLSGAGRTAALKILEDQGFEAVINPPLSLLERLIARDRAAVEHSPLAPAAIAIGVDSRTRDFTPDMFAACLGRLRQRTDLRVRLLYLDCDALVLEQRFIVSRRPHPLASDRPAREGIALERELLHPIRDLADVVIDSSHLALPDLRRTLTAHFGLAETPGLAIAITSFAYRRGLPREADLVLDARFLQNPHYVPELEHASGEDPAVAAFIDRDPALEPFFQSLGDLLKVLLSRYQRDGKALLSIAIGCTGGRHRSVYVASRLAKELRAEGRSVMLVHRDLGAHAE